MTKPSWQDFGTHDESIVPELWDGVIGAWAPCLGPTGSRLHDMSRRSNWGTLTNMDNATDWVVSDGQYALDFDNTDDTVAADHIPQIVNAVNFSVSFWIAPKSISGLNSIWDQWDTTALNAPIVFRNGAGISWQVGAFGFRATTTAGLTVNRWSHVYCEKRDLTLFVSVNNGQSTATATGVAMTSVNLPSAIASGRGGVGAGNMLFDDLQLRLRCLSQNELSQLYQLGRGGMYQRRRRRAIYLPQAGFQPAWALRRSQVIGGGLR